MDKISFLRNERDKLKMNYGIGLSYEKLDTEDKIRRDNEKYIKIKKEKNKINEKLENQCKTIEDKKNDYKTLIERINKRLKEDEEKYNYLSIINNKKDEKEINNKNLKLEEKYNNLINDINNNNKILKKNKNIISTPEQVLKADDFNKNYKHSSSSKRNDEQDFPITKINKNKINTKANNHNKSPCRP